ncbi:MAG: hypothetical protein R2800_06195 [Flavipsychrobacter sp.]
MLRYTIIVFLLLSIVGCRPEVFTPKPRGYYKIDLPQKHEYQEFKAEGFPYSFEHPIYSKVVNDTVFFGEETENPYWIVVDYDTTGGKLYFSYKEITPSQQLDKLVEDSYGMTYTVHSSRADMIEDFVFHFPERKVHGIFYKVDGNAATAYQFFATDSTKHFVRGALYFNVKPNADSLMPVNNFLREDIMRMIKTLEWH